MKDQTDIETNFNYILIAEDSPTQAEQLKYLLEKHNFKVIVARNGKEALNQATKDIPSLILSDIVMPEMNGYELCRKIKSGEDTTGIPVILLTSLTRSEDVLEGISCGADNFITKPYREDYLIAHIKQILANSEINKNERVRLGMEIIFGGKRRFITTSQQQMLSLLISTYEAAVQRNDELIHTQGELEAMNEHLEELVRERTTELSSEILIRKRTEERVNKLNRIYAVLSNINQAIVRIHDVDQLIQKACKIAVDQGKFQSSWIGIVDDTKTVITSANAGLENNLTTESPNQNPISEVLKSGVHFFSNIIHADKKLSEIWRQKSLSLGFRSFAIFPLIVFEKVNGVFCIYSNEINFFDATEITLLDEVATDISFALEYIHKELERKRDLAALVKAKEKAEESDRLKTAFLHNISHEIRTPLNAIIGFSELCHESDLPAETRNRFSKLVIQSSYQLLSIISDIISISTIEAGQVKISEKEIELNSALKSLLEQFTVTAEAKNIKLNLKNNLQKSEFHILTDDTKLVQILTNLIGNALKFTKQGHVNYGYEIKGNEIKFFVEDTGIGIPVEMQGEIFKRFSQVETTTAREYGGSGLGLSISKAYVEHLGGEIWLRSELGKGSIFYFTIPYKKIKQYIE